MTLILENKCLCCRNLQPLQQMIGLKSAQGQVRNESDRSMCGIATRCVEELRRKHEKMYFLTAMLLKIDLSTQKGSYIFWTRNHGIHFVRGRLFLQKSTALLRLCCKLFYTKEGKGNSGGCLDLVWIGSKRS